MAIWELEASGSISRSTVRQKTLPTNNSSYGYDYVYDLAAPERKITLNGRGLTQAEIGSLETALLTRNAVLTVTDSAGVSRTGRLESGSWEIIKGTNLYSASVVLVDRSFEASGHSVTSFSFPSST